MRNRGIAQALAAWVCAIVSVTPLAARQGRMRADEVVTKHLASIGSPEVRLAARSRVMEGIVQMTFLRGGHGQIVGKGRIVSEGRTLSIGMEFPAISYPGERLSFDGSDVLVDQVNPGERSALGNIVHQNKFLLKEGLLGGAMTTAWLLLDLGGRKARVDYAGLKEIEGRRLHELRVKALKGAGEWRVSFYFDPETFRHVRSDYRLVIPTSMVKDPAKSGRQYETSVTLQEEFGDFRSVDSLILPHSYNLSLWIEGQRGPIWTKWSILAEAPK